MKLALIIDKSAAFISFEKEKVLASWGTDSNAVEFVSSISRAGGASLFGDTPTIVVELADTDAVKRTVVELEDLDPESLSSGAILVSSVARTSTKKLEAAVAKLGGHVILSSEGSKSKISPTQHLLAELHLNRAAKEFLVEYVGDDYESLIPLIKTISALSPENQMKVTEEALVMRMPQAKGSVKPWEIFNHIISGDTSKAIDHLRRTNDSSSFLVPLTIIKNNLQLMLTAAALQSQNPRLTQEQLATVSGAPNNWGTKLALERAKKLGLPRLEKAAELVSITIGKVRGVPEIEVGKNGDKKSLYRPTSSANPMVAMEVFIVDLCQLLRAS